MDGGLVGNCNLKTMQSSSGPAPVVARVLLCGGGWCLTLWAGWPSQAPLGDRSFFHYKLIFRFIAWTCSLHQSHIPLGSI